MTLRARGEHAEGSQRAGIDNWLAIDEHLELAVAAAHHVHLSPQLSTEPCRHTDGM